MHDKFGGNYLPGVLTSLSVRPSALRPFAVRRTSFVRPPCLRPPCVRPPSLRPFYVCGDDIGARTCARCVTLVASWVSLGPPLGLPWPPWVSLGFLGSPFGTPWVSAPNMPPPNIASFDSGLRSQHASPKHCQFRFQLRGAQTCLHLPRVA